LTGWDDGRPRWRLAELGPEMGQFRKRRRSDQLGRDMSRQPRECRQTPQRALPPAGTSGSGACWWKRPGPGSRPRTVTWRPSIGDWLRDEERNGRRVAVGRTILVAAYHILKEEEEYQDLGGDYFDRLNEEKTKRHLVKRLEKLGYQVELRLVERAA